MFKGLQRLQKEFEEAQRAIGELEGDLGTVSFDPEEPHSVEAAIQQVNQLVDGRIGQYASNPFVAPIIDGLKESHREAIILKASEAKASGVSDGEIMDIFKEINNAVSDLRASQLQTFERPLKRLAQLLNHTSLQEYNEELTRSLDLENFLEKSRATQGSMVGSARLLWPEDPKETLGLHLLLIDKLAEDPRFATQLGFQFFYSGKKIIAGIHSIAGQLIAPFARDYRSHIELQQGLKGERRSSMTSNGNSKKIWVVHGQHDKAVKAVFNWLRRVGLEPLEWNQTERLTESGSPGTLDVIEKGFEHAQAFLILFTDDEKVELRPELVKDGEGNQAGFQPRPNVLFEGGMAYAIDRKRTVFVEIGDIRRFSDLAGINAVRLGTKPIVQMLNKLIGRLENAGCSVNKDGDHWMDLDDFEAAIHPKP